MLQSEVEQEMTEPDQNDDVHQLKKQPAHPIPSRMLIRLTGEA